MRVVVRLLTSLSGLIVEVVGVWVRPGSGGALVPWSAARPVLSGLTWRDGPVLVVAAGCAVLGAVLLLISLLAGRRVIRLLDPAPEVTVTTDPRSLARVVGHRVRAEEGRANEGGTWYTEAMYRSSPKLVRYLAEKYDIPLDREHIVGHDEVSADKPASAGSEHYDPGPYWDWAHYMGAPLDGERGGDEAVTIHPRFATNQPPVTECPDGACQ